VTPDNTPGIVTENEFREGHWISDENGHYEFEGLPRNRYFIAPLVAGGGAQALGENLEVDALSRDEESVPFVRDEVHEDDDTETSDDTDQPAPADECPVCEARPNSNSRFSEPIVLALYNQHNRGGGEFVARSREFARGDWNSEQAVGWSGDEPTPESAQPSTHMETVFPCDVIRRIQTAHRLTGQKIKVLAIFTHGSSRGLYLVRPDQSNTVSLSTDGPVRSNGTRENVESFVRQVGPCLNPDVKIVLYACLCGRTRPSSGSSLGPDSGNGDGSFGKGLYEALVGEHPQVQVWGHRSAGHTTRNPLWRVFATGAVGRDMGPQGSEIPGSAFRRRMRDEIFDDAFVESELQRLYASELSGLADDARNRLKERLRAKMAPDSGSFIATQNNWAPWVPYWGLTEEDYRNGMRETWRRWIDANPGEKPRP
jgi:hypothetical protein